MRVENRSTKLLITMNDNLLPRGDHTKGLFTVVLCSMIIFGIRLRSMVGTWYYVRTPDDGADDYDTGA